MNTKLTISFGLCLIVSNVFAVKDEDPYSSDLNSSHYESSDDDGNWTESDLVDSSDSELETFPSSGYITPPMIANNANNTPPPAPRRRNHNTTTPESTPESPYQAPQQSSIAEEPVTQLPISLLIHISHLYNVTDTDSSDSEMSSKDITKSTRKRRRM